MSSIEIVVISLPSAIERRRLAAERLNAMPWSWRFFDGHTAVDNSLPYDPERAVISRGYRLTPAEIGCFSSHFECIKLHAIRPDDGPQYRLVLEDDVVLDTCFDVDLVPALMRRLQIDYLRLFSRFMTRSKYLGRVGSNRVLYRFVVPPYGAQAYAISREGARRFVASVSQIERPVDDELDRYWANDLPAYALFPYPVFESSTVTTVAKGFSNTKLASQSQRARAFSMRWREKVRRERANLRLRAKDREISRVLREFTGTGSSTEPMPPGRHSQTGES